VSPGVAYELGDVVGYGLGDAGYGLGAAAYGVVFGAVGIGVVGLVELPLQPATASPNPINPDIKRVLDTNNPLRK
jgi:hypothetical protein